VFGAPADDHDHAANARAPRSDCCKRLAELNRDSATFQECKLAQRIGINSGDALVGNFGSHRRFNLFRHERRVNLASGSRAPTSFTARPSSPPKRRFALTGDAFRLARARRRPRQGRTQALKIYELLTVKAQLPASQQALIAEYAEGLVHWRAGEFDPRRDVF